MIDPASGASTGAARIAAWKGADLAIDLFRRALGAAAEKAGAMLARYDSFQNERLRQRWTEAAELVRALGKEPTQIPAKMLDAILHGASVQEDPDLATLWSAFIENAAIADPGREVEPRFPHILQYLSSKDAAVLAYLYDHRHDHPGKWLEWYGLPQDITAAVGLDAENVGVSRDSLLSLGLIQMEPSIRSLGGGEGAASPTEGTGIRLTTLGRRFVAACTPPACAEATPRADLPSV